LKKTLFISSVVASALFGFGFSGSDLDAKKNIIYQNTIKAFAPHEVIVQLKEGTEASDVLKRVQSLFGVVTHHRYKLVNAIHLIVPGKSFDAIKERLLQDTKIKSSIQSVEPNYRSKVFQSNDTYYDKLWAIENNGQEVNDKSGTKDADMDVAEAWNIEKGSHSVVVAVLDTGVDYTHDDLSDNMWQGASGHGYDFAGDNNGNNDDDPMPDTPYDDNGHYHGTHVAGTIGATGDNRNGISGVVQDVQIMAVKVFRPNGYAYNSDILEGLDYISDQIDNGENIVAVNASYGGSGGSQGDSMDNAIKKLGKKGVVFCAAAGNESKNIDYDPVYPASYDAQNIITVAASDQDDKLASFSNYGKKTVEVAAPGTNILSTYPDNRYAYLQGTSMATPNVTGTVALLASANPSSSVSERIEAVENGVDSKSSLKNKVSTNGRVNTYKAVKALDNGNGGGDDETRNTPPQANDDAATTEYETEVTIDVLKNDSDADGDTLTIKSLTQPAHGNVTVKNEKTEYTPDNGYSGEDSFTYTIDDGNGGESTAKVTVTVKEKKEENNGGWNWGSLFW